MQTDETNRFAIQAVIESYSTSSGFNDFSYHHLPYLRATGASDDALPREEKVVRTRRAAVKKRDNRNL